MERHFSKLKLSIGYTRTGLRTLITTVVAGFLLAGCVTPGTTKGDQSDFVAQNSFQYQSQNSSYQNPYTYGYRGGRPFTSNYSNNPYGQGYNSQDSSAFDYGNQGLSGSYNQSPTGAYLDQSGTPITPLRTYLRDNLTQNYTQPSPTLYRPTGGFDQPSQSWDTWPSYRPSIQ